jgi:hypothetical protein
MASRTSLTGNSDRTRGTMKRRDGLHSMSEKQAQAYLIARDVVRRIRRTCSLVPTPLDGSPDRGDPMRSKQHREHGNP